MTTHTPLKGSVSYDEMPYTSYPFADTHPSRLAAIAQIFGLNPPALENARILELGCASGGNLTPLALYYPNMQLVGVDYSSVQVNEGIETIKKLGLKNVELKHMSIADITPELGLFDYIICHGVYSWIPKEVQDAILRVCNENLVKNGVAYVSYNVYPGWKTHEIARDAMLFHTRNISNPTEQVAHGRGMIQYMHEMSAEGSMFRQIMNHESALIQNAAPYYISHEFFETHNAPCYFNEFNSHAEAHGLTYLGDTYIGSMFVETLGDEHRQRLISVSEGQQVVLEQYLDFISNRTFRQTLLVKKEMGQSIKRTINKEYLKKLSYQCQANRIENTPDLPATAHKYETPQKRHAIVYSATQKSALQILSAHYPNPLSYDTLKSEIKAQTKNDFIEDELLNMLERLLIVAFISPLNSTFSTQYIGLSAPTPTHPSIDQKVRQHALATGHLTSHMHLHTPLNPVLNLLLPLLDGKHNIDQLIDALATAAQSNQINFQRQSTQEIITDPSEIQKEARSHTQNHIELLKNLGYLIQ